MQKNENDQGSVLKQENETVGNVVSKVSVQMYIAIPDLALPCSTLPRLARTRHFSYSQLSLSISPTAISSSLTARSFTLDYPHSFLHLLLSLSHSPMLTLDRVSVHTHLAQRSSFKLKFDQQHTNACSSNNNNNNKQLH